MPEPRDETPLRGRLVALFEESAPRLAGAARGILGPRADVQELLQEAFLSAWRAAERGDRPRDPAAWLFVLTLNLARDQRRKELRRGPHRTLGEEDERTMQAHVKDPARTLIEGETLERTRRAIFQLDDERKEVFLLRVSGQLSFEAVADALSIPVGTAKSRMRSALAQLRHAIRDLDPNSAAALSAPLAPEGGDR